MFIPAESQKTEVLLQGGLEQWLRGSQAPQSWLRVTPPLPPYRPLFNGSSSKPNGSELFSNWFGHLRNRSIKELGWITTVNLSKKPTYNLMPNVQP